MLSLSQIKEIRNPAHKINDIFVGRWSPRALNGETITEEQFMKLMEAARWAPSAYNEQPWRFLYASKTSAHWNTFFNLLVEFNQLWCKNASHLMVVVAKKTYSHNQASNASHAFDVGAAWQNLALQASMNGLIAHGMAGFDAEKARIELQIPEDYEVCAMVAIGKPGDSEKVLHENLQKMEVPSIRKTIKEFAFEGKFKV